MKRHVFLTFAVLSLTLGGVAAPARQDVVADAAPSHARAVHYLPTLSTQRLAPPPCRCSPARPPVPSDPGVKNGLYIPGVLDHETLETETTWPRDIARPASARF